MNDLVRVAVLLSTYNGERYLKQQIDSILHQDIALRNEFSLKIYVRDDGSTDLTKCILEEYRDNGEIELLPSNENLGPAKSFLSMLKAVDADYYAFADQDDVWKKDKISRAVSFIKNLSVPAIYYANAELVNSDCKPYGKKVYKKSHSISMEKIMCCCNVLGCTMLFNNMLKKLFMEVPFSDKNIGMHDYYLCMICVSCGGKIVYDSETVMFYRQHENNVVGYSTKRNIKSRINSIFMKNTISISDDAKNILLYKEYMTNDGKKLLNIIAEYNTNFLCRIKLIFRLIVAICKDYDKHELLALMKILIGVA